MSQIPNEPVRAAGILLMLKPNDATDRPTKFLLMRHKNRWDLPKGHCDGDESFTETALRETEEETGIAPDSITLASDFQFELSYPVKYKRHGGVTLQKQVRYFLGFLDSEPTLTLTEHQGSQWFDWQPPHKIQEQTIDPLLAAAAKYLNGDQDA